MTIAEIQKQIADLEAQQQRALAAVQEGQSIIQQASGALALARAWLGKLMRAEDEARAAANAAKAAAEMAEQN